MRWARVFVALPLLLTLDAQPTAAQGVPKDRFSANRFAPAPGPGNYVMLEGARVSGHVTPTAGLFVDYAHRPLVVFSATCPDGDEEDCEVENSETDLVAYQFTITPMATLSL